MFLSFTAIALILVFTASKKMQTALVNDVASTGFLLLLSAGRLDLEQK